MKTPSASAIKGTQKQGPLDAPPREGSRLRELYDLFMANRGHVVDIRSVSFKNTSSRAMALSHLRETYGLDIRCVGWFRHLVAGEWCGTDYVDFCAEEMEKGLCQNDSLPNKN